MFHRGIRLAFGHMESFGEEFEMVDQLFHVGLHAFTARRSHFVVVGDHRARVDAQPIDTLFDDAVGLAHFFDAHQIAVVAVAGFADRDIEVHAVVNVIGLVFTQIPRDTRTTQHRACKA